MSARAMHDEVWDVQFAYPGKTALHWHSVVTVKGTEREAEQLATQLYMREGETAVDLLVVPAGIVLP